MMEKEWKQFESTGSVKDYLKYSQSRQERMEGKDVCNIKERVKENGTDHCTYRDGSGSYSHRGL